MFVLLALFACLCHMSVSSLHHSWVLLGLALLLPVHFCEAFLPFWAYRV